MINLSAQAKEEILSNLDCSVKSNILKKEFKSFFQNDFFTRNFENPQTSYHHKIACLNLIKVFSSVVKGDKLNWAMYCEIYNILHFSIKYRNSRERTFAKRLLKELLQYSIFNSDNEEFKSQLCAFSHLITENNIFPPKKYEKESLYRNRIFTNFPLYSFAVQIIVLEDKNAKQHNLFINAKNTFILDLLKEFMFTDVRLVSRRKVSFEARLFLYYFEESLCIINDAPCSLDMFNFDSFKRQCLFFYNLHNEMSRPDGKSPLTLLVDFYLFVDNLYTIKTNKRLLNSPQINKEILVSPHYCKYIVEGCELILKSPKEPVPHSNKWLLIRDITKSSTDSRGTNIQIDFTLIENLEHREDLKRFLWELQVSQRVLHLHYTALTLFLNTLNQYRIENISLFGDAPLISNDFLIKYRAVIENRMTLNQVKIKNRTANNEMNCIRSFIRYYQKKYQISNAAFHIFKNFPKELDGGNPIDSSDFEVISNEMQKNISFDNATELFYIIFQLSSTTKLRPGEVINLERDCIVSINESLGCGEIEYISKTSNGEKRRDILLLEDIRLIQRALSLTENNVNLAEFEIKKFIFLIRHKRYRNTVIRMSGQYYLYFNKLINQLHKSGLLKNKYVPYNTRHTYIDNAWGAVEDNLINSIEVGTITGNSAQVASQYYRKYKTKKYVEATYMVTIGDVNIDGEIAKDDKILDSLPQVQQGAGACKSSRCIKLDEEDTDYKCLICKKFVTSLNRADILESKLIEYKKKIQESMSKEEISYYKGLEQLYATYLAEIYSRKEESLNA
ncbi:hypothetical protein ABEY51_11545 [Priestia megaterium]